MTEGLCEEEVVATPQLRGAADEPREQQGLRPRAQFQAALNNGSPESAADRHTNHLTGNLLPGNIETTD